MTLPRGGECSPFPLIERWKRDGKRVVFTNGAFDILHAGHVRTLGYARSQGDFLVVGVNDDDSVRRLKGKTRPVFQLPLRVELLSALRYVDLVIPFSQDTPNELIRRVSPDVLVKGGDYAEEEVVGAEWVKKQGGCVVIAPYYEGFSTTGIVRLMEGAGGGGVSRTVK